MGKRHRQHLNPLKMTVLVPRERCLELPPGAIVEAELGCGDARFIAHRARTLPHRHFVGLDIREAFLQDARELDGDLPPNLVLACSNLSVDAPLLFPPARVRRFYVNFPDPWFKRRQHNRRWLTQQVLAQLVDALEPGGELFYQSDVWPLALEALGLLEGEPRLRNRQGEWSFTRDNPYLPVRSSRELSCQVEGLRVWRALFFKSA